MQKRKKTKAGMEPVSTGAIELVLLVTIPEQLLWKKRTAAFGKSSKGKTTSDWMGG